MELEMEKSSILTSAHDAVGDGVARFTGWAFMVATGNECKDYIKAIPVGTRVKLIGVDLMPTINTSINNIPKIAPNPDFPGFAIVEDESVYQDHPTILVDNPDYHIAMREV
jgi:hypothetical protein